MNKQASAHYNREKEIIVNERGEEWPIHFTLSNEVRGELESKMTDLQNFCYRHEIPLVVAAVYKHDSKMGASTKGRINGARTPIQFSLACRTFISMLNGSVTLSDIVQALCDKD